MKKFYPSVFLLSAFVMLPSQALAFIPSCTFSNQVAREQHWVVALVLVLLVSFYFWRAGSIKKERGLAALSALLFVLLATFPLVVFDDVRLCYGVSSGNMDKVFVSNLAVIISVFSVFVLTWWSVFFLAGVRLFRFYGLKNALRKQAAAGFVLICLGCVGALYTLCVFAYLFDMYSGPDNWMM